MTRNEKIYEALNKTINSTTVPRDWSDIVKDVRAAVKIPEGGFMVVRGVLQWMINEKMVIRTKNIHQEQYIRL